MVKSTKEEIFARHGNSFSCRVYYLGKKEPIVYKNAKDVNWDNVQKVTVLFDSLKNYNNNGENCKRDGVAYLVR